jgi:bifunctional non-homologous end joining protein LigD
VRANEDEQNKLGNDVSAATGTGCGVSVSWGDVVVADGDRVIDAVTGCTRSDLLAFGAQVAARLLPQLAGRAVSLRQWPAAEPGELHFAAPGELLGVGRRKLADGSDALEIACEEGLLHALLHGCIEFRTGHAHIAPPELPDRLVFALRPSVQAGWNEVAEAATRVRHSFHELGLACRVKTDGASGLHLEVPLRPAWAWAVLGSAAEALAAHACRQWPGQVSLSPQGGGALIDWQANGRASRVTASYSPCAQPGLGVSVPLRWGELVRVSGGDHWNVFALPHRLASLDSLGEGDPWSTEVCSPPALHEALRSLGFPVDLRPG